MEVESTQGTFDRSTSSREAAVVEVPTENFFLKLYYSTLLIAIQHIIILSKPVNQIYI